MADKVITFTSETPCPCCGGCIFNIPAPTLSFFGGADPAVYADLSAATAALARAGSCYIYRDTDAGGFILPTGTITAAIVGDEFSASADGTTPAAGASAVFHAILVPGLVASASIPFTLTVAISNYDASFAAFTILRFIDSLGTVVGTYFTQADPAGVISNSLSDTFIVPADGNYYVVIEFGATSAGGAGGDSTWTGLVDMGAEIMACPLRSAYYDGMDVLYLDCTP